MGDIVDVLGAGGRSDVPYKTVPIPHCFRADGSTLCQYDRTGLRVADDVCPGHCAAGHYRSEAPELRESTQAAPTALAVPQQGLD